MKSSLATLGPFVTADRMVRDYVEQLYVPAGEQGSALRADDFHRARALAQWKARVRSTWGDVSILAVDGDITAADVGDQRTVSATIRLGSTLSTDDICVELAHGPVGASGEISEPSIVRMEPEACHEGTCTYTGSFKASKTGLYGYAVRVLPSHEDLTNPTDLGLLALA